MLRKNLRATALNAAFLQEIKQDHRELQGQLGELRAWVECDSASARGSSCDATEGLLSQFEKQLRRRFELEEAYGYFREALIDRPWLGDRADALRAQHPVLSERLADMVRTFRASDAEGPDGLRQKLREFLAAYDRHEQDENDLITAVFSDEVGVGD